jgi:hypothetical protein
VAILTFHDLEATAQVLGDPTAAVLDALRHHTSPIAEAPVHGDRISAQECFDHHVQHASVGAPATGES